MSTSTSATPTNSKGTTGNPRVQILVRVAVFVVILVALWGLASGRWNQVMPWVFIGTWFVVGGLVPALAVPVDQALAEERTQIKEGVQAWDKPIVILGSLYMPLGLIAIAALDVRFGWSPSVVPLWLQVVALVVGALGYLFSVWASAVNKFYGRFVRIQEDRGHQVISDGPYRYVRHPGYAGLVVYLVTSALALNVLWTLVPSGLIAIAMIVRTALEDKFLQENLPGYREYTRKCKYRLLPGIW
jgi:protein-S-isoprenylcysteine O-methyltransferase Ste14